MILAHGCSHTHGTWHAQKYGYNPWPEATAELLNEDCVNIAVEGHNCQAVAFEIVDWCAKHGMPNKLLVGWPGFNRLNNFSTYPSGWQADLIGESILKINKEALIKNSAFYSTIFANDDYRKKTHININTFLAYQKIMAMLMIQDFCKVNNIEYYYFSWDNCPWIFLPEYEEATYRYLPYNKQFIFSEELIRSIDIHNNLFWDWTTYAGCARKLHVWWARQGIIGHGEIYPTNHPRHPERDHHWGKDMHDKLGELMYNFITRGDTPNPTSRKMELLKKKIEELDPEDDQIRDYWDIYAELKMNIFLDEIKQEPEFIYD